MPNAKGLLNLVAQALGKGVSMEFHKNNLTFILDSKDHFAKLLLTVLALSNQFERKLINSAIAKVLPLLRAGQICQVGISPHRDQLFRCIVTDDYAPS